MTGTVPGFPLPGGHAVLPINWDVFTGIMLGLLLNTPVFSSFMGSLDADGQAQATLSSGPIPGAVGLIMSYAYALNSPFDYASNGVNIEFVP